MKVIQYWCQVGAPNYVLKEEVCIQTEIKIASSLAVNGNTGYPFIQMRGDGLLTICADYAWDGATGIPNNKKNMFASLVHDALYQILRVDHEEKQALLKGITRKEFREDADRIFMKLYRGNGATGLAGTLWTSLAFYALRLCAKHASVKSNTKSYWGREIFEKVCKAPAKGAEN